MKRVIRLLSCSTLFLVGIGHGLPAQAEEEMAKQQQFLFTTESAYVQDKGEVQLTLDGSIFENQEAIEEDATSATDTTTTTLGFEYGITENLTAELSIPYLDTEITSDGETTSQDGIGDIEFGAMYGLLHETDTLPAIAIGVEVAAPAGDEDKGLGNDAWGYGATLAVSKRLTEDFTGHLALGYEFVNNATDVDDGARTEVDEDEVSFGIGVAYDVSEALCLTMELNGVEETEKTAEAKVRTHELYLTPGFNYEVVDDLQIGVGVAIGLNNDSYDYGAMGKIVYEFNLL